MKLIAWNIRAGGGQRAERIAQQLIEWKPDLVALSEFRSTPASRLIADLLAEAGLSHQISTIQHVEPGRNALLVASRFKLKAVIEPGAPTEPGRWIMVVASSRPSLHVGALHVPNQVTGRKPEFHSRVLDVIKKHSKKRFIIMGDTNSGRMGIDEQNPAFNRQTTQWFDAIEEAGWVDAFRHLEGPKREYTWYSPNKGNGFRLDQAFVSPRLRKSLKTVTHAWAGVSDLPERRAEISDHAALLVDLDMR